MAGSVAGGEARRGQPVPRRLPFLLRRRQSVAERYQFIDLGDDAGLLCRRQIPSDIWKNECFTRMWIYIDVRMEPSVDSGNLKAPGTDGTAR